MIQKMTMEHVSAVAEMEQLCFSDPWSESSIAYELINPLSLWLVAVENGEAVGYIGCQSVPPESDIMNVAVHPDYRRRGLGEALVDALVEQLRLDGNTSLTLEVRVSNESAIALYHKLGFQQVGRRPNYYRHPKEDALILRKPL